MRELVIDGSTTPDINTSIAYAYGPQAPYPPYTVFEPATQRELYVTRWLWLARLVKWKLTYG